MCERLTDTQELDYKNKHEVMLDKTEMNVTRRVYCRWLRLADSGSGMQPSGVRPSVP